MARNLESGHGEYTADGSVDLNGKPVLRSKTGGWKACSFIVVYEVFERTAFFGISSNLILYLTNKLHQGTVEASNNVTNWVGTVFLTPLLGGYIADAYFGRYWTFLLSSFIYLMGMCLLTVAVSIPSLKPPPCQTSCPPASTLQLGVFFGALYILAIGNGGAKPNISTIGADQFDELHPRERMHKLSFFNWWTTSIFLGTLFANTVLVYLQDNVGWSIGYGIPTLGLLISIIIFLAGTPFYRHKMPQGSPFTRMARVILAAIRKWNLPIPADGRELYELDLEVYAKKRMLRIDTTNSMRFLNKAAVKGDLNTKWTLCPVTHVEETKAILRMLPVFVALFIPYIVVAQSNTLFIKQGTTLNRHIGPDFQIPPASLGAFITISMLASVILYDRYFVKIMRTWTNNPRGITILQRIGVALFIHIITLVVACLTERRRLNIARNLGLDKSGGQVPLTIFTLVPQFVLMGLSDSFLIAGVLEFFYDQAPESMKSLGTSISLSTYGVGNFLSSSVLTLVSDITSKEGKGWILNNLNASHLDYYYAFLAILSFLNFILFLFISYNYTYRVELSVSSDAIRGDQGATNGDTE